MNANAKREIRMSQVHDPTNFDCGDITRCTPSLPTPAELAAVFSDDCGLDDLTLSRTIRRVETIVNFKDEFGRGDRPDWSEFANAETIWESYERIKAKGK